MCRCRGGNDGLQLADSREPAATPDAASPSDAGLGGHDGAAPVGEPDTAPDGTTSTDASDGGGDGDPETATLTLGETGTRDFGLVVVGAISAGHAFTISNTVGTTGIPVVSDVGPDFTASNGCTSALRASDSCTITVAFKPSSTGDKGASLIVTASPGGTVGVLLRGKGISPEPLTITPAFKDFGTVTVGDVSPATNFTVFNPGRTPVTMLVSGLNGADFIQVAGGTCTATLATSATCFINLAFKPTLRGARTGSLVVSGDGMTTTVGLTGMAQSPPAIVARPMDHAFTGRLDVPGAAVLFTFTNVGDATTGVLTASLSGADKDDFVITNNDCLAPLSGGSSCTVAVAFKPSSVGSRNATLSVTGTGGGTATANLTGAVET